MGNRPYKLERSNVDLPLWRKKVDATIVISGETPVPNWVAAMWGVDPDSVPASSRNDAKSQFDVKFKSKRYLANLYLKKTNKERSRFYLSFDSNLGDTLAHTFSMTWARAVEGELRTSEPNFIAENAIPFWEFLDIECDVVKRELKLTAHYRQEPIFPSLFQALLSPESRNALENAISKPEGKGRMSLSGWIPRKQLTAYRAINHAVYVLLDRKAKLIYVGQAGASLVDRLRPNTHPNIDNWDHFSFCEVPKSVFHSLNTFESMLIHHFALIFDNNLGLSGDLQPDYTLVNRNRGPSGGPAA
ncbi:GIY-YIG nuclease family protein [Arenicellales bacterium IMCC57338]